MHFTFVYLSSISPVSLMVANRFESIIFDTGGNFLLYYQCTVIESDEYSHMPL